MHNLSNPRPRQHSNTSEVEGLTRSLRAMKNLLIGMKFVLSTNYWSVLYKLRGQTQIDPIIKRLEELMYPYREVVFVVGKEIV